MPGSRCAVPTAWACSTRSSAARPICRRLRDPAGLAGNVGIVSQSGGFCVSLLTDISRFGFSHIVSSGNEAVVNAADFLEYLVDDPHTKVIGCFIETVRAPEQLCRRARPRRRTRQAGGGAEGRAKRAHRRAVASHTAGDAGDPAAFSELLRAHRAIEVADLAEFTEVLAACQGARRPAGRRIGVVTSSGGLAELMLDMAGRADLRCRRCRPGEGGNRTPGRLCDRRRQPARRLGQRHLRPQPRPRAGALQRSPDHDIIVFCRDNCDGQPMDARRLRSTT